MLRCLSSIVVLSLLAACAGLQGPAMTTTSALVPDAIKGQMRAGESALAPDFYYVAPASEGRSSDKVLIDPLIYFSPLTQRRTISPEDRQTLPHNLTILVGRRHRSEERRIRKEG